MSETNHVWYSGFMSSRGGLHGFCTSGRGQVPYRAHCGVIALRGRTESGSAAREVELHRCAADPPVLQLAAFAAQDKNIQATRDWIAAFQSEVASNSTTLQNEREMRVLTLLQKGTYSKERVAVLQRAFRVVTN